jgi:hypothetical protein
VTSLVAGAKDLMAEAIEQAHISATLVRRNSVEGAAADLACFDKPENRTEQREFFRC